MLRGCREDTSVVKSMQRGMVTAQTHALYAAAQVVQFWLSEYCEAEVALQGISCSEREK